MLHANNIYLTLNNQPILQDVSLQLHPGEFVGLIGPNGAGKTSLLRILADLQKADSGEVQLQIATDNIQTLSAMSAQTRARLLAYLPQQEKPAWPLTVEHLVGLGRAPWRTPMGKKTSQDLAAIAHALQVTDTQHLAHRPVNELSGG